MITFIKRWISSSFPVIVLFILLLISLDLISNASQNSAQLKGFYSELLLINLAGLVILLMLIGINIYRLIRQYRHQVPGILLTIRMVLLFVLLGLVPVSIVYYYSLQFLKQGIDSWFDVEIEQTMQDALDLSRNALDLYMREKLYQTQQMLPEFVNMPQSLLALRLDELRQSYQAYELTLFNKSGQVMASSHDDPSKILPSLPKANETLFLSQRHNYMGLDIVKDQGLSMRIIAYDDSGSGLMIQALFPVPEKMDKLANSIKTSFSHYREIVFLHQSLMENFALTLSLVLLFSSLTAIWMAFGFTRRLVKPIQELVAGTQAVAKGDYSQPLKTIRQDELGFLVQSFNNMMQKIASAQQQLEQQHEYLQTVLQRLSSGVLTFDETNHLKTANQAAEQILGVRFQESQQNDMLVLEDADANDYLDDFFKDLQPSEQSWEKQIELFIQSQRRVLICRGSYLPNTQGYVVVFDDVTKLIQAEKDTAWGEVARRLAHEIKNPLTPIRLSAERLQRKILPDLDEDKATILKRSIQTIVQQVEAMQSMVNAFSQYAKAPDIHPQALNLNHLLQDVLDLYRGRTEQNIEISLNLAENLPKIRADSDRLRQMIHNLIKNSLEAFKTNNHNKIEVMTDYQPEIDDSMSLQILDNGSGFDKKVLGHLFEPYITTKTKGTGLGLAIVKKIVEEHGGMIHVENRQQGGASIKIRFPVLKSKNYR